MADPIGNQDLLTLLSLLSVGSNTALLVSAVKIIRNLSRMELKVDTMWGVFVRRFGTREQDVDSGDKG